MKLIRLSFIVFLFALASQALAHSTQSGAISIGHIWSYPSNTNAGNAMIANGRLAPQGFTSDIYGPLVNGGNTPEAVTSVTSPAGSAAGIVMWVRGNQMTRTLPLELPPGKPVALGPQTQFLRLYGLNKAYKAGESFPVTFHFQHSPDATIEVVIEGK
jgi:copper(I)-binding protein